MYRNLDGEKIADELDNYNAIAERIAKLRDIVYINITPGSRLAKDDTTLVGTNCTGGLKVTCTTKITVTRRLFPPPARIECTAAQKRNSER